MKNTHEVLQRPTFESFCKLTGEKHIGEFAPKVGSWWTVRLFAVKVVKVDDTVCVDKAGNVDDATRC